MYNFLKDLSVFMSVLPECMKVYFFYMLWAHGGQKRALDSPDVDGGN